MNYKNLQETSQIPWASLASCICKGRGHWSQVYTEQWMNTVVHSNISTDSQELLFLTPTILPFLTFKIISLAQLSFLSMLFQSVQPLHSMLAVIIGRNFVFHNSSLTWEFYVHPKLLWAVPMADGPIVVLQLNICVTYMSYLTSWDLISSTERQKY